MAVCEARCAHAVEDTSKFVELHNILHKITSIVFFGILFLANSRRNMDDVIVVASLNGSVSMTRFQAPFRCTASMENVCQFLSPHPTPTRASKPRIPFKN